MSDRTLFVATVAYPNAMPRQLRIAVGNRADLPFTLDCDTDRRGSPYYLELPRRYQTARGAKLAAARIVGEPLTWTEPSEDKPGNFNIQMSQ